MATDRGMKKFNAFKALTEHEEMAKNLVKKRSKISKPVLSDDELEIINDNLVYANNHNSVVELIYYNEGFLTKEVGNIKIEAYNRLLFINKKYISFDNILKLMIKD